mgnify:CR=1 FL=1
MDQKQSEQLTLYKYLGIDGAKMMLYYSDLQYTNATQFNDPFDSHPGLIDFSNVPPEKCKGWSPEIIKLTLIDMKDTEKRLGYVACRKFVTHY